MKQTESKPKAFGWRLVAAGLAPLVPASAYVCFDQWSSVEPTTFDDCAALAVSILVGALFVATLPIRVNQRVVALLIYVPIFAVLLFVYAVEFSAIVFHEGL